MFKVNIPKMSQYADLTQTNLLFYFVFIANIILYPNKIVLDKTQKTPSQPVWSGPEGQITLTSWKSKSQPLKHHCRVPKAQKHVLSEKRNAMQGVNYERQHVPGPIKLRLA